MPFSQMEAFIEPQKGICGVSWFITDAVEALASPSSTPLFAISSDHFSSAQVVTVDLIY